MMQYEMKTKPSSAGIRPVFWLLILVLLLAGVAIITLSRRHKSAPGSATAEPFGDVMTASANDAPTLDAIPNGAAGKFVTPSGADELRLKVSSTEIILAQGWHHLMQPETFFIQQRATHQERGIALSAGAVKIDLSVEQYVALGLAGLMSGPEKQLDRIAQLVQIPRSEVDHALQSQIGQQTMEQVKQASRLMGFELLGSAQIEIAGTVAFEVHSKATVRESGQAVFSRQFVFRGTAPREIVQVTYASPSEDIFQNQELLDAIRRPLTANSVGALRNAQTATENVGASSPAIDEAVDYLLRGSGKGQRHDFNGAIADFNKAIELKPDFAEAYNARGLAHGALAKNPNDTARALADYNKAVELKPDFAEAYYNRGVVKQTKGDKAGALADQSKAIELKPDYARAYFNRGMVKAASRDLDGAIADYNKAIELKPDYSLAYQNRGNLKKARNDLIGARADYTKATEFRAR